ncbi:hypothetical protein LQ384_23625 [Rhodococcus rhodochrous]|uniref:Sigma-54 factor interaction domain-containing protein n=1 Tax=Rhodococcus rhodochrous TaxID=1829 RepID=A0AAW4XLL9_RHORH|nr:helix-turn-helix domain-containing protein [Rhodococcus rhodochrous]MCD2114109.1 hypothetical protein [Rhodococcus rhodochrous]
MSTNSDWYGPTITSVLAEPAPLRPLSASSQVNESWRRSALCGVDRDERVPAPSRSLPANQPRLVETARPILDVLASAHNGAPVVIVLMSVDGRLVHVNSQDEWMLRRLNKLGLIVGANWSEETVGTTPLGLTLMTGAPATTAQGECFLRSLTELAGAGAPIVHPLTRRTHGVLGVLTLDDVDPRLLAGTAQLAAHAVERALEQRDCAAEQRLLTAYLQYARSDGVPVLAFSDGIEMANAAGRLMCVDDRSVLRRKAEEVVARTQEGMVTMTCADGQTLTATAHRCEHASAEGTIVRVRTQSLPRPASEPDHSASRSHWTDAFIGRSRAAEHVRFLAARTTPDTPMVLLTGEGGTGKFRLAQLIATQLRPEARTSEFDAGTPQQSSHDVVEAVCAQLAGGQDVVILRHAELLDISDLIRIVTQVKEAPTLRLLITWTTQAVATPIEAVPNVGAQVHIPPLRERPEDIVELVPFLIREIDANVTVAAPLMQALLRHDWPGNVSELTTLLRTIARPGEGELTLLDLPSSYLNAGRNLGRMEHIERLAIIRALQENAGNKLRAAQSLGIGRATLYRKLRTYRINLDEGALASPRV